MADKAISDMLDNMIANKGAEVQQNFNDICLKLEKCDIESITDYLIKVSNEKNYPNISLRE